MYLLSSLKVNLNMVIYHCMLLIGIKTYQSTDCPLALFIGISKTYEKVMPMSISYLLGNAV